MNLKRILVIAMVLAVSGCVESRNPDPISIKQANDGKLACRDVEIEYKTNTEIATRKIEKNNSGDGQDVLLGILIWPGLADFKNADGTEGNALLDRNVYLRNIAVAQNCDITSLPKQPARYE